MTSFKVNGMTCADCSERLEILLRSDPSCSDAHVYLMSSLARVKPKYASFTEADISRLCGYGNSLGFVMTQQITSGGELNVDIEGLSESALNDLISLKLTGVKAATLSVCPGSGSRMLKISYEPEEVGARHVLGGLRAYFSQTFPRARAEPCLHEENGEESNSSGTVAHTDAPVV